MINSFSYKNFIKTHGQMLETHIAKKQINNIWLWPILNKNIEKIAKFFPYHPAKESNTTELSTIKDNEIFSIYKNFPKNSFFKKIIFLINIPFGYTPSYQIKSYEHIKNLFRILVTESFGTNNKESIKTAKTNIFLVIGINQIKSIDERLNKNFKKFLERMPRFIGINNCIYGFTWTVKWTYNQNFWFSDKIINFVLKKEKKPLLNKYLDDQRNKILQQESEKNESELSKNIKNQIPYQKIIKFIIDSKESKILYKKVRAYIKDIIFEKEKAFLMVKYLDDKRSKILQQKLEKNGSGLSQNIKNQIPYQKIRENIKNSRYTNYYSQVIKNQSPNLLYFMTMDSDLLSLRVQKYGYFTYLCYYIKNYYKNKKFYPHVVSFGYFLSQKNPAISVKAVRIDMEIREYMNKILPGSGYFPEPLTGYLLKKASDLNNFSFLTSGSKNKNLCESRRAIENGIKNKIIDREKMLFLAKEILHIKMPKRMNPSNEKYKTHLPQTAYREKDVLSSLRNISQVHFEPLSFGKAICEIIPEKLKKGVGINGKISGIISRIFKVFDPISNIEFCFQSMKKYVQKKKNENKFCFSQSYQKVIEKYPIYSQQIFLRLKNNIRIKSLSYKLYENLLKEEKNLEKLKFDKKLIDKIILTAKGCGSILYSHISGRPKPIL